MYSIKGCEVSVYMKYHIKGYNLLLFRETLYLNTCTESDAAGRNASIQGHFREFLVPKMLNFSGFLAFLEFFV